MDTTTFAALLTPAGQALLAEAQALAPDEAGFLRHFTALQRRHPADLARAALEIAILRAAAGSKFPHAQDMYFTRPALEQASSQAVARYRAGRFALARRVLDLGCSIGGDSLALAEYAPVIGLDLDRLRLALAQANAAALGLAERCAWLQADLGAPLPLHLTDEDALFFDPARRDGERRLFSVRQYQPPLAIVNTWRAHTPALGVKISPGVKLDELAAYDAEIEFISLHGELKEAALWFGPLRSPARLRATLLAPDPAQPGTVSVHSLDDSQPEPPARLHAPQSYLYEPDPAVLRAGLVRRVGLQLDAAQLDEDIAYLTGETAIETPFARRWQIEAWFPFQLKRLRAWLHQHGVGRVTIKKRASPLEPQQLMRDLRLRPQDDPHERVLVLTHLQGEAIVIICLPYTTA